MGVRRKTNFGGQNVLEEYIHIKQIVVCKYNHVQSLLLLTGMVLLCQNTDKIEETHAIKKSERACMDITFLKCHLFQFCRNLTYFV